MASFTRFASYLAVSIVLHVIVLNAALGDLPWLNDQTQNSSSQTSASPLSVALQHSPISEPIDRLETVVIATNIQSDVQVKSSLAKPSMQKSDRLEASANPQTAPPPSPNGIFGSWYYAARYLHRRPTPLKPIRPDYPAKAELIKGRVQILLFINERGEVDLYKIKDAEPAGVFDTSVIEAFFRARYAPGMITGHAVKSQLLAEVYFEPGVTPQTVFTIMDTEAESKNK